MKISGIETIRVDEFPNILFVQVHTDAGLTELGTEILPEFRDRPDVSVTISGSRVGF